MTDCQQPSPGSDSAFGGEVGEDLPGASEQPVRATSPATGQASAAAGRAAYANAPKGTPASEASSATADAEPAAAASEREPAAEADNTPASAPEVNVDAPHPDSALAAERLVDLQRLQAEYVNYKKRVDRDRDVERERAIASVIEALLPVLDEIHLARQHGELADGPFAKIAEKLEGILGKYGVQRYGEPGEEFDPMVHDAVMHMAADLPAGTTNTTVVQIMQPGYLVGDKVLRAALVAVADPA